MPNEAPAAAPVVATEAAAPAAIPGADSGPTIAKYVALARADIAADAEAELAPAEPATEAPAERGPDGKFLPRGAKAGEVKPKVEAKPADKPKEELAAPSDATIAQARKLLSSGDIDGAFKVAFGKVPELTGKDWANWRHANERHVAKVGREIQAERAELDRDKGMIQQYAQTLAPMLEARRAWEAGDAETAIRAAFGEDVTSFNKKLLAAFHGKSPQVSQLERELAATRAEIAAWKQEREQAAQQQTVAQAQQAWVSDLSEQLAYCGDTRFEARATRQGFLKLVVDVQAEHYDARNNRTLPPIQAAEIAWDRFVEQFGEDPPGARGALPAVTSERSAKTAASGRGGTPVRQVGKPTTNLRQSEAAEASAPPKFKTDDERMAWYVRKAKAELHTSG